MGGEAQDGLGSGESPGVDGGPLALEGGWRGRSGLKTPAVFGPLSGRRGAGAEPVLGASLWELAYSPPWSSVAPGMGWHPPALRAQRDLRCTCQAEEGLPSVGQEAFSLGAVCSDTPACPAAAPREPQPLAPLCWMWVEGPGTFWPHLGAQSSG